MGWPQKLNTFNGRMLWRTLVCDGILAHYSSPGIVISLKSSLNSCCPVVCPKVHTPVSVVQDDIQQRAVNVQSAVIVDEAQLAEPVHEEVDSGARGANDLGQHLLADFGNHRLGFALLPEVRQQEQHPRQPLFAGVEKLVYQVLLNADVAGEQIPQE